MSFTQSSITGGNLLGAGTLTMTHSTTDRASAVTTETCVGNVRIDSGTFVETGC